MITGADVYINIDNVLAAAEAFDVPILIQAVALTRLLMHEIGHTLGFDHPNEGARNFDTDFDPRNRVAVDPLDPFAGILVSPFFDRTAIMARDPCLGDISALCLPLFFQELQPDDRHGRDVLYPVVPEPGSLLLLAGGLALLARRRRAAAGRSSPRPPQSGSAERGLSVPR